MKKLIFFATIFSLPFGEGWGGAFAQTANEPGSGNALQFNGTSDRVVGTNALNFAHTQPFTLEAWIRKFSGGGANQEIISKMLFGSPYTGWEFQSGGNFLRFDHMVNVSNAITTSCIPTIDITDGNWHHVAVVKPTTNANDVRFYVDGVLQTTVVTRNSLVSAPTNSIPFEIGTRQALFPFFGQIDEVRIWNTARTQTEIQQNMCHKLPDCADPNLVGYWRFDEGIDNTCSGGQDVCDASCNGNHGVKF